jgi:sigma-E factor negative regulatory protein RseC
VPAILFAAKTSCFHAENTLFPVRTFLFDYNHIILHEFKSYTIQPMNDKIEHKGVVESISADCVRVSFMQVAACAECKAKALCSSAESKEKSVDIHCGEASRYKVGDVVNVCGSLSMGRKAVRIAFLWPMLIVLLAGFVTLGLFRWSEPVSMGLMLLLLTVYFFVAYLNRDRIGREFAFWIESVSDE